MSVISRGECMNIRNAFLQSVKSLEPIFEMDKIDNKKLLHNIKNSWEIMRNFSKNIDNNQTSYFEELIGSIDTDDIPLTDEMFNEANDIYSSLKVDKDIKSFLQSYFRLLKTLLIFNKPLSECCDVCQGVLFYYFEENANRLIIKCDTCSSMFLTENKERVSHRLVSNLRPAKRIQLISLLG
jgi:hypothetical protein